MSSEQNPNSAHDGEIDEATGVKTTGHEWDGIKELNNPLPRWWLIIFYASIVWAVIYWIFMPAWPGLTGNTRGIREHSERENVALAMEELHAFRADNAAKLLSASSLQDIENDPDLLQFAMAAGESAFGDNCATCHGAGGRGALGYPNLNDDVWLWGGTLDDIKYTITYGIRSGHDQARYSMMPAYGDQNMLTSAQISSVVDYVLSLGGETSGDVDLTEGREIFETQCAACHMPDGTGMRALGAPNLTDTEWLFGGDRESIRYTIAHARNSQMPYWGDRLDEATITSLAVYVHTLGGGE